MSHKTRPKRVQRKRIKGYRMPDNTVSVCRPGKWGNPFSVEDEEKESQRQWQKVGLGGKDLIRNTAQTIVVSRFRAMMLNLNAEPVSPETYARFRYMRDRIRDLEGKNLACFCANGTHCHADVLLELANPVDRTQ